LWAETFEKMEFCIDTLGPFQLLRRAMAVSFGSIWAIMIQINLKGTHTRGLHRIKTTCLAAQSITQETMITNW